ncbi:MAG: ABC transporter permease [Muribaculaceae bacterium]|nr:ABC transporter permease [Muribaculaceae bacterium]
MSLSLKIALRYLKSKKAHNAVNIISIVSICGVVITTAALVCVLSVFNGFYDVIYGKLAKLDPQIAVCPAEGKTISNADSAISVITSVEGVDKAMPVIEDQALAVFVDYQMPLRLKGVPADYDEINSIDSVIVDGEFALGDGLGNSYAIVGIGPAIALRLQANSLRMLQLYAPRREGQVNVANPVDAFTSDSLFVKGIFQVQQASYDQDLIFVPIDKARELFDYDTEATQIELKLKDGANEKNVIKQLEQALGPNFVVKNRLMQQSESFRMVNVEKWVTFLLLTFIMIIATFNIISTLSLLIIEKDESIRTFQNLGATSKQITRIFVAEGWLITMLGAMLGIVLGLLLCLGQQTFGWLKIGADPTQVIVNAYPVKVVWTDMLVVVLLVAAIGFVTSLVTSTIMRRRLRNQMPNALA